MNGSAFAYQSQDAILALGALQFFGLWLVSAVCSVGLVWAIGRWMDRR